MRIGDARGQMSYGWQSEWTLNQKQDRYWKRGEPGGRRSIRTGAVQLYAT